MAVTTDIVQIWRRPGPAIRRKLEQGATEGGALALLMGACLLIFVAQTPVLARAAHFDPSVPLDARMAGALLASLFLVPLIAYAAAGLSHLIARALGGRGSGMGARLALFWAMLATTPIMLLQGLLSGLVGPTTGVTVVGGLVAAGFLYIWGTMLLEVER